MPAVYRPQLPVLKSRLSSRLIVSLLIACLFGVAILSYFGAYIALADRQPQSNGDDDLYYEHVWEASLFEPAAKVESAIRNKRVFTGYAMPSDDGS